MALDLRPLPASEPAVALVQVRDVFKIYKEGLIETVALRGRASICRAAS